MDDLTAALRDLPIAASVQKADFDGVSCWIADDKDRYLWRSQAHLDIFGGTLEDSMHVHRMDVVSQGVVEHSAPFRTRALKGLTANALLEGQVNSALWHTLWVPLHYGYMSLWTKVPEVDSRFPVHGTQNYLALKRLLA